MIGYASTAVNWFVMELMSEDDVTRVPVGLTGYQWAPLEENHVVVLEKSLRANQDHVFEGHYSIFHRMQPFYKQKAPYRPLSAPIAIEEKVPRDYRRIAGNRRFAFVFWDILRFLENLRNF